jgi:hypothetical protein
MTDEFANSPLQRRPSTSRKNYEGRRSESTKTKSPSMEKVTRDVASDETFTVGRGSEPATLDPSQEPKAKRKPRKLALRNHQASSSLSAPLDEQLAGVKTNGTSLEARVSVLEYDFRKLNKRTNSNTLEIDKLQAFTKLAPVTGTTKDEISATKVRVPPNEQEVQQASSGISLSNDPQPTDVNQVDHLSDEEIETIPRTEEDAVDGGIDKSRSVALKGSYKIPLPSTLSTDDVRAVQNGLAAASSVARELAIAMTGGGSGNRPVPGGTGPRQKGTGT